MPNPNQSNEQRLPALPVDDLNFVTEVAKLINPRIEQLLDIGKTQLFLMGETGSGKSSIVNSLCGATPERKSFTRIKYQLIIR